ncbi:hypothetical protein BDF21DRAFT_419263, partial [Thamnidium elegans]
MTCEERLAILKSLLDVSNKLLGSYISKNKLDADEEKLYKFIKKNKESIDQGLFLIPDHSINKLKMDPVFDESKTENYLNQIEMINLAIFTYNVLKGRECETCVNNFFRSIIYDKEVTSEEIEFYVKLRHFALATHCKENKNCDISKAIEDFFPKELDKLYFLPGKANFDVPASVNCYRLK